MTESNDTSSSSQVPQLTFRRAKHFKPRKERAANNLDNQQSSRISLVFEVDPNYNPTCPEFKDRRISADMQPSWNAFLKNQLIENYNQTLIGMCYTYYRVSQPEVVRIHRSQKDNKTEINLSFASTCASPFIIFDDKSPSEVRYFNEAFLSQQLELPAQDFPVKQRRAVGVKEASIVHTHTKEGHERGACGTDVGPQCHICNFQVIDGGYLQNEYREFHGTIQPFAEFGEYCTLENEAYLHGLALSNIATAASDGEKITPEKGYPWGRLDKFWPNLVNLNVAELDKDEKDSKPACAQISGKESKADADKARYVNQMIYGDCIFNQRLATDPTYSRRAMVC